MEANTEVNALHKYRLALLKYFDESNIISVLHSKCLQILTLKEEERSVYRFEVQAYVPDLMELDPEFCHLLLANSDEIRVIFKDALYFSIANLKVLPFDLAPSQILPVVRLEGLPSFSEYTVTSTYDLVKNVSSTAFFKFSGYVCSLTGVSEYTSSTWFKCPHDDCLGYYGDPIVRVHIPGATEKETLRKGTACSICTNPLVEDARHRVLGKKTAALILLSTSIRFPSKVSLDQCVTVTFRDELLDELKLGYKYSVVGSRVQHLREGHVCLRIEANNAQVLPEGGNVRHVPAIFESVSQRCGKSPWAFVIELVKTFACGLGPEHLNVQMKLTLLCSLVASDTHENWKVNSLLFLCQDTNYCSRLLEYAATFAERCVRHSLLNCPIGTTRKETGNTYFDAGSLHLATGGVCLLGEAATTDRRTQTLVVRVLGSGLLSTDNVQDGDAKNSRGLDMPLRCSVWACGAALKPRSTSSFLSGARYHYTKLPERYLAAFSLVFVVPVQEELEALLVQHILSNGEGTQNVISDEDWYSFCSYMRSKKLALQEDARELLRGYYLGSRRASCLEPEPVLPINAMSVLALLAESVAKLSLRHSVTCSDVALAVALYEEMLFSRGRAGRLAMYPLSAAFKNEQVLEEIRSRLIGFVAAFSNVVSVEE